jgi:transcriptional regulator with XRE-family HTH domain
MHTTSYVANLVRQRIQRFIGQRKISEAQMAAMVGINQSTLNRFLRGETERVELHTLVLIAQAMGIDLATLVSQKADSPQAYPTAQMVTVLQAMESLPEPLQIAVAQLAQSLRPGN